MISSFTQGNQSYVGHCTVIKEIEEEIVQQTTMGRFAGPSSQVQAQAHVHTLIEHDVFLGDWTYHGFMT